MPTLLTLLRHGETDFNRQERIQGRGIDAPLNATGVEQAQASGRAIRMAAEVDAVYSSSMRRAIQTASIAMGRPEHEIAVLRELEEMDYGAYEGVPVDLQQGDLANLYGAWERGELQARAPGGESPVQVRDRALPAVRTLLDRHPGRHVLVVTHGRVIRILIAALTGMDLSRMGEVPHANGGFYHLEIDDGTVSVRLRNHTDHLTTTIIHE